MKYEAIIIANIAEAFEEILERIKNKKERIKRIQLEHNLCERSLLWEGNNKVVVTPFPIHPLLLNNNKNILGFRNVLNLSPRKININLSKSIFADKSLLKKLISVVKNNPGIKISPYAVTPSFIFLVENLIKRNLKFAVEERPVKYSDWIVRFLDSKVGSRLEIDKINNKDIKTPKSIICRNKKEAIDVAQYFYEKYHSCVIKANFGEGGWGTIIINNKENKSWNNVLGKITKSFKDDSIWNNELIIIEQYIKTKRRISSGCPSVELFLSNKGPVVTYVCDQLTSESGEFLGVAMGKNALNSRIKSLIIKESIFVGQNFWELGYRGFFDIDFVISDKDRTLYIIETNMRRTGGTHVFDTVRNIFGINWEQNIFILSQDSFEYGKKLLSEKLIFDRLKDLLFPIKSNNVGVIVSIINKWKPMIGFIIIEQSEEKALEIREKLKKYLKS